MTILNLDKNILFKLIFNHLQRDVYNKKCSKEYFEYYLDRNQIIIKDITKEVSGNDCWNDCSELLIPNEEKSKVKIKETTAGSIDIYFLGEFFNSFLIDVPNLNKVPNEENFKDVVNFLDNYVYSEDFDKFLEIKFEKIEEDYYHNYKELRTLKINLDLIFNYLEKMPMKKDISEINNVFNNLNNETINNFLNEKKTIKINKKF